MDVHWFMILCFLGCAGGSATGQARGADGGGSATCQARRPCQSERFAQWARADDGKSMEALTNGIH